MVEIRTFQSKWQRGHRHRFARLFIRAPLHISYTDGAYNDVQNFINECTHNRSTTNATGGVAV